MESIWTIAFIFVFGTSFIVFKLIDLTIGMRASDEEQEIGLDVTEHSASGYPDLPMLLRINIIL